MGMLAKQPWLKWAMQEEIAADVSRDAMSSYKDTKDYHLNQWLESEGSYGDLFEWAKEQF